MTASLPRFAIRVKGRGVVVDVNGEPITSIEQAEDTARFIREALLEECSIERLLLDQESA